MFLNLEDCLCVYVCVGVRESGVCTVERNASTVAVSPGSYTSHVILYSQWRLFGLGHTNDLLDMMYIVCCQNK